MKKIHERSFSHKKVALFLLAMCFVWLQISNANESEYNYFEDRDQDGLTDQEEQSLGTDPDKADTDGDGYSDGVEVENGYDPLVASPGDVVIGQVNANNEEQNSDEENVNLTEEFLENFEENNVDDINAIKLLVNDPIGYEQQVNAGELDGVNLTEDEIIAAYENTVEEVDISDEVSELTDEEVNILEPVEGETAEEILNAEKEQVEEYFVQVGYILLEAAPFEVDDENDITEGVNSLVSELTEDIGKGDMSDAVELESVADDVYEQLLEVEVPYVLKDIHKSGLALMAYSLDQDTSAVFEGDDPLEVLSLVGKAQGVISEFENLESSVFNIFGNYGIDEFIFPELGNIDLGDIEGLNLDNIESVDLPNVEGVELGDIGL